MNTRNRRNPNTAGGKEILISRKNLQGGEGRFID